jgi:hypothetical protein
MPRLDATATLSADAAYAALAKVGLDYGPAHRSLSSVQLINDSDGKRRAFARLTLPDCLAGDDRDFSAHPSIVDGALQALIALRADIRHADALDATLRPMLPFAIEEVELLAPTTRSNTVFASESVGSSAEIRKFDLDVSDDAGRACVRIKGYTARVPRTNSTLLMVPSWRSLAANEQKESLSPATRVVKIVVPASSRHRAHRPRGFSAQSHRGAGCRAC